MRNDVDLSPSAVAHFVRGELASSLRSRKPYNVNLLLGGVDPITLKPSLYWLDYLASLAPLPYAAHGYAQYVINDSFSLVDLAEAKSYMRIDITACRFLTSTTTPISTSNRA
jgi:20S proteasome alpha/beta subunit